MPRFAVAGPLIVAVLTAGCSPPDEIRSYTVARTTEAPARPRPTVRPAEGQPSGGTRLLGAMVPTGSPNSTWFVKARGPAAAVAAIEAEFDLFLASLRFTGDGPARRLAWTLPDGWRVDPAKNANRLGSFFAGPKSSQVNVYVSIPFGGDVLGNVNRWAGEVGLPGIGADELNACTTPFTVAGTPCVRVDLSGPGGPGNAGMPRQ